MGGSSRTLSQYLWRNFLAVSLGSTDLGLGGGDCGGRRGESPCRPTVPRCLVCCGRCSGRCRGGVLGWGQHLSWWTLNEAGHRPGCGRAPVCHSKPEQNEGRLASEQGVPLSYRRLELSLFLRLHRHLPQHVRALQASAVVWAASLQAVSRLFSPCARVCACACVHVRVCAHAHLSCWFFSY